MKLRILRTLYGLAFILNMYISYASGKDELRPPNIVWITSEDNSKHYMKLFDKNGVETPNIRSMANHGLLFTKCFSNAPVCSVARSTLISGIYSPRAGSQYHRKLKKVPMPENVQMFPAYLREAGYYTTNNSKEDYNFFKPHGVWDESSKNASYRNRKGEQPFFHVINIGTTHESSLHFGKDEMANPTKNDPARLSVQPNHPDSNVFKYTNARYRDNIVTMDGQVGEVMHQLKEDGLLANTFVFYFGDHGGVLPGSKGYLYETGLHVPLVVYIPEMYKQLVDATMGSRVDGFVSFIDFAPTVLHLAGVPIPESMDGKPFLGPKVKAEELAQRDETYGYADRFDEKYDMVRSFRKGRFKYIRSYQPFNFDGLMNNYRYLQLAYREWADLYRAGKLNDVQARFFQSRKPELLYDIESDPYETQDLSQNPEYSDILVEMRNGLRSWTANMPDLSFFPEHYLIGHAFDNPVSFGKENKYKIRKYIETADLALLDFGTAEKGLIKSLRATDPWERYWGLIACSTFGARARSVTSLVKTISQNESEKPINRVRAAEFLGLIRAENPIPLMTNALYETKDGAEALLILNAMVLMKDGQGYSNISLSTNKLDEEVKENDEVKRRLAYLVQN
ncbi:sulfatase family protein [Pareuzebyella sediminis]|uniref:sulfatase family protein n=1 Tax=Pareuzebyella sediminis TaxID=2607998 RepID=UPI0011EFC60C|nr:sulfatase [Pareuzebyella sediminis]